MQEQQLNQLREAGAQLQAGLGFAKKNLDDLNVRAPLPGKLSGFNIEIGQSIARGGRLGQIDDPEGYKLNVNIDEYYLGRVDLQQTAVAEHRGTDIDLQISKIYPQVNAGQFEVDMVLAEQPTGLRRGQTMQVRLTLGDNSDAILIPNGSFYQDTGGNWLFVVSADGSEAVRRPVSLGRRNTEFIEVLDGLEPGEKVVTSPYTSLHRYGPTGDRRQLDKIRGTAMLKLHNMYKVYSTDEVETVALNGVNLEIEQGDFVAIMGPSGCGKSTLLNIVGMLDNPSDGDYFFFDENIARHSRIATQ